MSPSRILVAGIIEFPAVFPRRDWSKPDTSRRDYRVPQCFHEGMSPSRRLVAGIIEFPAVFPRRDESKPDTSRRDYRVPCSVSTKGLVQAGY